MSDALCPRLIEVALPIREISAESVRDKNVHHAHISHPSRPDDLVHPAAYGELFRCFIGPAARMNLDKLRLGVQFEMETSEGQGLGENDPSLKAMREAARQLGLNLDVE